VQSLPFLSAVAMGLIEGSRFNSFAYWRSLEARFAEYLPRSKVISKVIAEPPKLPSENHIEAAQ
jgi:hypothetical protein